MTDRDAAWTALTALQRQVENLEGIVGLLQWDQQTMMPPAGGSLRGEHIALVTRLVHERLVEPRVGEWLDRVESSDPTPVQRAAVRNIRRAHDRAVRVPPELVERLAAAQTEGFESWMRAKQAADFSLFAPALHELVELTVARCQVIDPDRVAYDVLLEEFDPGTTTATLRPMFDRLRAGLVELIDAVSEREPLPALTDTFDPAAQRELQLEVVEALGYDLASGRLDEAEHPFTVGFGPGDVRITTHLYPDHLLGGLGGAIHEAGHAMYEQGLPIRHRGTSVCQAASLGLHESQSRFWENTIGRSLPFFRWLEPRMAARFPGAGPDAMTLYRAANRVVPDLIRVQADEVTYNLHIIVRFELETALLAGDLPVEDLPAAWNDRYREVLGVVPLDDARGVLQDVHWSSGMFAYFPSYTLGNLYAAGLGEALVEQMDDLWERVERGDFAPVLQWLRRHVHERGHLVEAPELVRDVTGDLDLVESLLGYLWGRHGRLHGVSR